MRNIHSRAPTRSMMTFEGTSNRKYPKKKNACADAEGFGAQSELTVHRECGEANIHPIQEIHDIEQAHERNEPPRDFREEMFHLDPTHLPRGR